MSYPPLTTLYKYRVVVCTPESAGFLTRARKDRDWNAQNFKYVIIDDCAALHETMTFTPIAGSVFLCCCFFNLKFDKSLRKLLLLKTFCFRSVHISKEGSR